MHSAEWYIKRVFIKDLLGTDLAYVDKVLKMDYNEVTLDEVVSGIKSGDLQLWRWPSGILITEKSRKELNILYLIGSDFIKHWKKVELLLTKYAFEWGLDRIQARTENETLIKLFNRYFTRGSVTYYKEITNAKS